MGNGDNPDDAWGDAVEGLCLDPGETPEEYKVIEEEEEEKI